MFDPAHYDFSKLGEILKDGWTREAVGKVNDIFPSEESVDDMLQIFSVLVAIFGQPAGSVSIESKAFQRKPGESGPKHYLKYWIAISP